MKCIGLVVVAGFSAMLLLGCKHRDDEVVGKWKNPLGTMYTFNPGNTFTRENKSGTASGTWSVTGDTVTTRVDKVNNTEFKASTEKKFRDARSMLPPDYVAVHSTAEFALSPDGRTMSHKNSTTGKNIPYTKL